MKTALFTALFTCALVAAPAALAQPMHGGTPLMMLGKMKAQLNLNTSQAQQFDAVVAQAKAARETARANFAQVKTAMQTEMAKSEPDFAAVAAVADGVRAQNAALRKQVRDAWLALYANFSPEQKGLARDTIQAGFDRFAARRAAHAAPPPSTN